MPTNREELRLPRNLLDKAIISGNEYGWRQYDLLDVIEAARQIPMAVLGGQVQYILPNGTYELYWLDYDSSNRKEGEEWKSYCKRSANECSSKVSQLFSNTDIEAEAINAFEELKTIVQNNKQLVTYKVFILYFDDSETDLHH